MSLRKRIIAATPLICLIIYLSVGYIAGIWHPTWAVFILIPLMPIILCKNLYKEIYPLTCAVAYLVLGICFGWWHPAWIIFLTIPVYYILFGPYISREA